MDQPELLRHTTVALDELGVGYMLVGSFASTAYGEPRFTQDIDIVIELPEVLVDPFCGKFPEPDFFVSKEAVTDAIARRFQFNVLHLSSGVKIDFIFPEDNDWGRDQLRRSRRIAILPEHEANTASPEDVIIGKLRYYSLGESDKHIRDIAGMLKVSGTDIDRESITRWAEQLGLAQVWRTILDQMDDDAESPQRD